MVARLNLKGIYRKAPPGMEPAAYFDSTRGNVSSPNMQTTDRWIELFDSMGSGAWPFLTGGVRCLVNSVFERDVSLLSRYAFLRLREQLLRETLCLAQGNVKH